MSDINKVHENNQLADLHQGPMKNLIVLAPSLSALLFKEMRVQNMPPVQVVSNSDLMLRRFESLAPSRSTQNQMELKMKVREKAGASKIVVQWVEDKVLKPS